MAEKQFPAQSSAMSAASLAELVASRYAVETPVTCRFWRSGVNDTYMLTAGATEYALRVYRYAWRTKEEIQAEIDLLSYLHGKGVSVSAPIRKKDGGYLNRLVAPEGIRYMVLFSHAAGKVEGMNTKRSRAYGKLVARMHVLSDAFKIPHARFHIDLKHLLDDPLPYIKPFLADRKGDFEYLVDTSRQLKAKMASLLPVTKPEYGVCHGDHHGGNLHFDDSGRITVFDFDCFGYGWRAYDIAVFRWARLLGGGATAKDKAKSRRQWEAFLDGYSEERVLTRKELAATALFVPIRHIWLIGFHTQGSPIWGRSWLNDGYFTHQIGLIKRWIKNYRLL